MKKVTLEILRQEIDAIDNQLLELLQKRVTVVKKISEEKKKLQKEPLDRARWQIVVQKWRQKARDINLSEDLAEKIYDIIHTNAIELQKK